MKITILIPTLNEEKTIEKCLASVAGFNDPDILDIYVIDGMSSDGTRDIVLEHSKSNSLIKLIDNPGKTVPYAMNIGIGLSKGDYIVRLDAHSSYPPDYLDKCKAAMRKVNADNIGGVVVTVQNGDSYSAKLVQMISTHPFGVGNSQFRLNPKAHFADTVPFGFHKRSSFEEFGYFDERLTRNQDYEFNSRTIRLGGKVWLDPQIKIFYKNKSTVSGLLKQAAFTGKWNSWMWRVAPHSFKLRHSIPAVFVTVVSTLAFLSLYNDFSVLLLSSTLWTYFLFASISSIHQAFRYRSPLGIFLLPPCFFIYHVCYGLGIIGGGLLLILGRSEVKKNSRPWKGATDFRTLISARKIRDNVND